MSMFDRQKAIDNAQKELRAYESLFQTYKQWRETVYTESFANPSNKELRRKFSEEYAMLMEDLTEKQFDELETDFMVLCR